MWGMVSFAHARLPPLCVVLLPSHGSMFLFGLPFIHKVLYLYCALWIGGYVGLICCYPFPGGDFFLLLLKKKQQQKGKPVHNARGSSPAVQRGGRGVRQGLERQQVRGNLQLV